MGLAGLVLLLVVIIIRLSSVELPKPIVVRVDERAVGTTCTKRYSTCLLYARFTLRPRTEPSRQLCPPAPPRATRPPERGSRPLLAAPPLTERKIADTGDRAGGTAEIVAVPHGANLNPRTVAARERLHNGPHVSDPRQDAQAIS